ncbi:M15 family metallopeptidase [Chitinivorax sp. B]|uniref:M15 family metallopeptidase n=1 Tax=Chitinivorax sp. B TaxID=2502235 RepID=UPI002016FE82|nr:M15 family metallopeptidase [Chitinivorax sp. B]
MSISSNYLDRLAVIHRQLGIAPDYAATRQLIPQQEATLLTPVGLDTYDRDAFLIPAAANAWLSMQAAAVAEGIVLELVSAFRSVAYQQGLIARKMAKGLSMDDILLASAAPGFSEHHTGRAVDVTTPNVDVLEEIFETTQAFAWLIAHAAEYGFHMSFPRANPHGISYEPWHWAFAEVGQDRVV